MVGTRSGGKREVVKETTQNKKSKKSGTNEQEKTVQGVIIRSNILSHLILHRGSLDLDLVRASILRRHKFKTLLYPTMHDKKRPKIGVKALFSTQKYIMKLKFASELRIKCSIPIPYPQIMSVYSGKKITSVKGLNSVIFYYQKSQIKTFRASAKLIKHVKSFQIDTEIPLGRIYFDKSSKLETLSIGNCALRGFSLKNLPNVVNIRRLKLNLDFYKEKNLMKSFGSLKNLDSLSLICSFVKKCESGYDEMDFLEQLPKLKALDLGLPTSSDAVLRNVSKLVNLCKLRISIQDGTKFGKFFPDIDLEYNISDLNLQLSAEDCAEIIPKLNKSMKKLKNFEVYFGSDNKGQKVFFEKLDLSFESLKFDFNWGTNMDHMHKLLSKQIDLKKLSLCSRYIDVMANRNWLACFVKLKNLENLRMQLEEYVSKPSLELDDFLEGVLMSEKLKNFTLVMWGGPLKVKHYNSLFKALSKMKMLENLYLRINIFDLTAKEFERINDFLADHEHNKSKIMDIQLNGDEKLKDTPEYVKYKYLLKRYKPKTHLISEEERTKFFYL